MHRDGAGVTAHVRGNRDVSKNQRDLRSPHRLLPVPTDTYVDVGVILSALAADREPRIDVLIGPDDTGKSALIRQLVAGYRRLGDQVHLIDLSLVDWRDALMGESRIDVAFVDHLDRIAEREHFRAAFTIIDRVLPALFSTGMSRLVLTLGSDWREAFRRIYRMNPDVVLRKATPTIRFEAHAIRPYTDAEVETICGTLKLDPNEFREQSLRRPGVLAMASSAADDSPRFTGACLREVLALRWIEAGNDTDARDARQAMWELLGRLTLHNEVFAYNIQNLSVALGGRFGDDILRAQAGGPLRWEGEQVQSDSPAWGDVAGAKALQAAIEGRRVGLINRPLRTSVLDALVDLSDHQQLANQVERGLDSLRGKDFTTQGYLGPIVGTLTAQLSSSTHLAFDQLSLQGPDHAQLHAVDPHVVRTIEEALLRAMAASMHQLLAALKTITPGTLSAYRGGYRCWEVARRWAGNLPLRASAEDAILNLLPGDGSWRYEDVLDVSVTGASTQLMERNTKNLAAVLRNLPSPTREYMADIWDGINDGAWDQISANSRNFVSALYFPPEMGKILNATSCRMQRANFGSQNARDWRFIDCDLLLADFRSCRNIESVDFTGSNWWSAILPPPARYHLSRRCSTMAFFDWCSSPPWTNPHYIAPWPMPFD